MTDELLTCRSCRSQMPAEDYHRDRTSRTGRKARCKSCANSAAAKRRLAKRAEDYPVSFDWLCVLAARLDQPERRALYEHLRPDAIADQLFNTKENENG